MHIVDKEKLILAHSAKKIKPNELLSYFLQSAEKITTLSLDCFDTLLWRKTAAPIDVFYQLHSMPTFQSLGLTADMRAQAETKTRQRKALFQNNNIEVTLSEIYQTCCPNLSSEQLNALIEEELTCEMNACYAFPPIVELLSTAHELGKQIIIVSDTYLSEQQLHRLLKHCLPANAYSAISKVFCSSEFGLSKVNGLFNIVANSLRHTAEATLHIGDNLLADYVAARFINFNALHMIQENETMIDLLRLRAIAAHVVTPNIRIGKSLLHPYRGITASSQHADDKPETIIGYASLGPIMFAFAHFILKKIREISKADKAPKVLFLLRDAHLPMLACEALSGQAVGQRVHISRFAAYAASFRSEDDIKNYLLNNFSLDHLAEIARQLLLPEKVYEPIIKVATRDVNTSETFINMVLRKDTVQIILRKSAEYRERLMRYLNKESNLNLSAGDHVLLVDLGYSGTTQKQLTPILNELGIKVSGCYLIALRTPDWQASRSGLLDPTTVDDKIMRMLVTYISLLEQLCTSPEQSVIDYDNNGKAIFADTALLDQYDKLSVIQQECLRFIHEAKKFFASSAMQLTYAELQETAKAELARMIFLPTTSELHYLQSFNYDLNLGTNEVLKLFDPEKGLVGMRRRGLDFMERDLAVMRTNYPAEVRTIGFEYSMLLMLQNRYGIDIKQQDMLQRKLQLNCLLTRGQEKYQTVLDAAITHDGFYSAWLPIGKGDTQASIMLGDKIQWLQIESAELIPIDAFVHHFEGQLAIDAWDALSFVDMAEQAGDKNGRLFVCVAQSSHVLVKPRLLPAMTEYVFRLVFRPIIGREAGLKVQQAGGMSRKISL